MTATEAVNFTIASLISAENEYFTEEQKQAVITNLEGFEPEKEHNWWEILEPLGEEAHKWADFLTSLETIDEDEPFEQ